MSAFVKYSLQDIGTFHTHSSRPLAINNEGEILGWFNLDGTQEGKRAFLRNREGVFYVIENDTGYTIDWNYLTDHGEVYGKAKDIGPFGSLFVWNLDRGIVCLGELPGPEISAINNRGQVLIKSVSEVDSLGNSIRYPVIWENGNITKLGRPIGDLGSEAKESYGLAMNNQGVVIGYSLMDRRIRGKLYTQFHATQWIDGEPIDLYEQYKDLHTGLRNFEWPINVYGVDINDHGDILMKINPEPLIGRTYLLKTHGMCTRILCGSDKVNNRCHLFDSFTLADETDKPLINGRVIQQKFDHDLSSPIIGCPWKSFIEFTDVNDNDELIGYGVTLDGKEHAMLLTPVED